MFQRFLNKFLSMSLPSEYFQWARSNKTTIIKKQFWAHMFLTLKLWAQIFPNLKLWAQIFPTLKLWAQIFPTFKGGAKYQKATLSPDFPKLKTLSSDFPIFKRRNRTKYQKATLSPDFPYFKRRNLAVLLSPGQLSPFRFSRSGCPQNCFWRRKKRLQFFWKAMQCVILLQLRHILVSRNNYSVWGLRLWVWLYVFSLGNLSKTF